MYTPMHIHYALEGRAAAAQPRVRRGRTCYSQNGSFGLLLLLLLLLQLHTTTITTTTITTTTITTTTTTTTITK